MSKMTIIDNEYVTLCYYPDKRIVHHQFHKFIHGQAFRDVLNTGVEILEKHRAHKWLSDDRKNSALPQEDVQWAQTDWFPRAVEAGWKYWALIQPEKMVGQMNLARVVEDYSQKGVIVRLFTDPKEAMTWLENQ